MSTRIRQRLTAEGLVLLVLVAWYVWSTRVPEFVIPSPLKVLRIGVEMFYHPDYVQHTFLSLLRVLVSVGLALLVGTVFCFTGRYVPTFRVFIPERLLPFLNAFPSLGWAMLAVIWFGVSDASVVFVETAILLPFCMINVWEGFKTLDTELEEMGRSFTRSGIRRLFKITLPMLFPYLFSALRVSYGVAWKVSLVAELFGAQKGIGYLLNLTRQNFDTPVMLGAVVAIIGQVYLVDKYLFQSIERILAGWRQA